MQENVLTQKHNLQTAKCENITTREPLKQQCKNLFGFMTTISEPCKGKLPGIRINYKKENLFSTPDTNMLAQISQLSCGKSILDFID